MMRYEPQIMDVLHKLVNKKDNGSVTDSGGRSDLHIKKADKSAKNGELSTFIGGGERWRKKVENTSEFLKKMSRKEVEVPGLAFHVVIIGRLELKRIAKMNKS